MKSLLLGLGLGALGIGGCRPYTLPPDRVAAYAQGQVVRTIEGYPVHLSDGGTLAPIARDGTCLRIASEDRLKQEAGTVTMLRLEAVRSSGRCSNYGVAEVLHIDAGEALTMLGKRRAVHVRLDELRGVRISGHDQSAAPHAPITAMRNPGLVVSGAMLMATSLVPATYAFYGAANAGSGWLSELTQFAFVTGGIGALGAGFGAGVPMVVIGAKQVREPTSPFQELAPPPPPPPPVQAVEAGPRTVGMSWSF